MGTAITVIILLVFVLFVLAKCVNSIQKSTQKFQGRNRCEACKSRLKAVNGRYAGTCRKCGRTQSWAVPARRPTVQTQTWEERQQS